MKNMHHHTIILPLPKNDNLLSLWKGHSEVKAGKEKQVFQNERKYNQEALLPKKKNLQNKSFLLIMKILIYFYDAIFHLQL